MKGLMTLTWRVSDGVDAKLSYIAEAPWDQENRLATSRDVYYRYAVKCYGAEAAEAVTEIINENEAFATDASECVYTPLPSGKDRARDIAKAEGQLAVIAQAMEGTKDGARAERLRRLYCRIRAVKAFCRLDQDIKKMGAEELTEEFRTFVECFVRRIDDISTAGNLFSVENRYVQEWYLKRMEELGADTGAAQKPGKDGRDEGELQVLMISPVTVIKEQSGWDIRAAVIGGKRGSRKAVRLCYREAGSGSWKIQALEHRVRGVFGARIPAEELPEGVVEYYVEAGDGERTGRYPAAAPGQCAVLSRLSKGMAGKPEAPVLDTDGNMRLRWKPCHGEVCWYRIYRGTAPGFSVGPQSLVTYVGRDTLSYLDVAEGFDGEPLSGDYYYRVSCVDGEFRESVPSNEVCCRMEGIGIRREMQVQGKGASAIALGKYDLNTPESLGLQDREGIYTFDDGWGTVINSPYKVSPEGFVLSAGKGDAAGRFTFRLPWKYEPEYPYLLVKAEAFSGDWNFQVNGVPVVGPRENNVAVRKDLRIFGFRPGDTLTLTLLVNRPSGGKDAGTIFRSLQLLPEGGNFRAGHQESRQKGERRNEF